MIEYRASQDRGQGQTSWLDSRYSFSFADYDDPRFRGFGALRVLNEDWIAPASGFGAHPHFDMEIVTILLSGQLEHRDTAGNRVVLTPGMVQRMTAGRGIVHSEMNPSADETTHLFQIWIEPRRRGLAPSHEELVLDFDGAGSDAGDWAPVASRAGGGRTLRIEQTAEISMTRLLAHETTERKLDANGRAWLQVASGSGRVAARSVEQGDALAFTNEDAFIAEAGSDGLELLLIELDD